MISIIIPIGNSGRREQGLLAGLKTQTVSGELIIVDSSMPAVSDAFALRGARVIRVKKEDFDHGGVRSMAAEEASGEILVFLTQDVTPYDERSLEKLILPFEDAAVGAVYGRQLPYPDASPFAAHLRFFNYPQASFLRSRADKDKFGIKTPFLSNAFSAYRRAALLRVGGFKRRLILGEDTYAGARMLLAGYKIAYAADAAVYHSHNYTALQEFKRYFDIGVFHKSEKWILDEFGRAEGEGAAYVRSAAAYLVSTGRYLLLPELAVRTALKLAGYNLGMMHDKLPLPLIKRMSMHRAWWERAGA